jgi:hypothetical protein
VALAVTARNLLRAGGGAQTLRKSHRAAGETNGTRIEGLQDMAAALALCVVPVIMIAALAISSSSITPLGIVGLGLFLALLFGAAVGLLRIARTVEQAS